MKGAPGPGSIAKEPIRSAPGEDGDEGADAQPFAPSEPFKPFSMAAAIGEEMCCAHMVFKRNELKTRIAFTQPFDGNLVEMKIW